ncbi:YciI family protein [Leifsonia sp. AG29]|uniref:YciI family protein n=1 Tax=Leifsonia sp. AG29 TaxID=2598860 RepID=UPI00131BC687|nr:YciI family protein [Leifsonia sp. AG29]
MQFLVNVIDSRSESGTEEEAVAIDAFNEKLQAAGHWVFAAGLADPSSSTVIDARGDTDSRTPGPFAPTQEWAAGFWIIEAPGLDDALELMTEGSRACNRRLEVRPLLMAE